MLSLEINVNRKMQKSEDTLLQMFMNFRHSD